MGVSNKAEWQPQSAYALGMHLSNETAGMTVASTQGTED